MNYSSTAKGFLIYNYRHLFLFLLFTIFNSGTFVNAQNAIFEFEKAFCECHGEFDSTKFTRVELENTIHYLWDTDYFRTNPTIWRLEEAHKFDAQDVINESEKFIELYENLDYTKNDFWTKVMEEKLQYYKEVARLREVTALAYETPKELLSFPVKNKRTLYYRDAIIKGGDLLIVAWKKINEENKKNNAEPMKLQLQFNEEYQSKDKMKYAFITVMEFGWWNSANEEISHFSTDYSFDKEFEKLLIKVDCHCDDYELNHEH